VCVLDASSSVLKNTGKNSVRATQIYSGYDYSVIVIKFAMFHNEIEYRICKFIYDLFMKVTREKY